MSQLDVCLGVPVPFGRQPELADQGTSAAHSFEELLRFNVLAAAKPHIVKGASLTMASHMVPRTAISVSLHIYMLFIDLFIYFFKSTPSAYMPQLRAWMGIGRGPGTGLAKQGRSLLICLH